METETDRLQERGRGRLSYSCLSLTHKVSASSDLSPAFLFWQEKKNVGAIYFPLNIQTLKPYRTHISSPVSLTIDGTVT